MEYVERGLSIISGESGPALVLDFRGKCVLCPPNYLHSSFSHVIVPGLIPTTEIL
jgi:hypothetical protein